MIKLQEKSEMALKVAQEEMKKMEKSCEKTFLEMRYNALETRLSIMNQTGMNISNITPVMEQLKLAIQKGDYKEARKLIQKVEAMIMKAYMQGVPPCNETGGMSNNTSAPSPSPSNMTGQNKPHKP